jgi:hypothetical protein
VTEDVELNTAMEPLAKGDVRVPLHIIVVGDLQLAVVSYVAHD